MEMGTSSTLFFRTVTSVCQEIVACENEYPQHVFPEGAYPWPPGAANQPVGADLAFTDICEITGPGAEIAGVVNTLSPE
jgi:hypothetical protein